MVLVPVVVKPKVMVFQLPEPFFSKLACGRNYPRLGLFRPPPDFVRYLLWDKFRLNSGYFDHPELLKNK